MAASGCRFSKPAVLVSAIYAHSRNSGEQCGSSKADIPFANLSGRPAMGVE